MCRDVSLKKKCFGKEASSQNLLLPLWIQTPSLEWYYPIHQGKSRWHSYLVLVYIRHVLTYLLGTVPYILTMGYIQTPRFLNPQASLLSIFAFRGSKHRCIHDRYDWRMAGRCLGFFGFHRKHQASEQLEDVISLGKMAVLRLTPPPRSP